jgi:micrococcal nuclease
VGFVVQFQADNFTSSVVSILDGDTIEVLHNHHAERIRLSGIDCPEKNQAFGQRAKHAASALAFGKQVTVQTHGYDKYKRTLGDVIMPDGVNLNQELVKQGWCWWYRKYASGDTVLEGLEKDAREARKGLGLIRSRCRCGSGGNLVERDGRRFDFPSYPVCNSTRTP